MGKDQKIINKFLELFPDELAKVIFYSLEQNIVQDNVLCLMTGYLTYVRNFNLSFESKILKLNHSTFHESFENLDRFISECFFRLNPKSDQIVLHPDVKHTDSKMYKRFSNELSSLLEDMENKYNAFRKLVEEYSLKDDKDKVKIKEQESKKYSNANEDILLKTLGIKIKGDYILRGDSKKEINPTDKALIYFLYFKLIKNADECFSIKDLSKEEEIKKSERYIKNRITFINQSIREIISKQLKLRIGRFIKNERKRGYRLNPKILLIKTKK